MIKHKLLLKDESAHSAQYRVINNRGKTIYSFSILEGARLISGRFVQGLLAEVSNDSLQILGENGEAQTSVTLQLGHVLSEGNIRDYPPDETVGEVILPIISPTENAIASPVASIISSTPTIDHTYTTAPLYPTVLNVIATSTPTVTPSDTPTSTPTATATNAAPVGMVSCIPATGVGETLSGYSISCSGGSDPDGGSLSYRIINSTGGCPKTIDSATGMISSNYSAIAESCSYEVQACDNQGACGATSTTNQLHSYFLNTSASSSATLSQSGNDCAIAFPITVTQSNNISNLQYSSTINGVNSIVSTSSGVSGLLQPGSTSLSGTFRAANGQVAGVTVPEKSTTLSKIVNPSTTPFPAVAYTPSSEMHGKVHAGVQLEVDRNGASCLTCIGQKASVSVGQHHSCAVGDDHKAWCWGNNSFGQLGNGTTTSADYPVMVSGLSDVLQISAGFRHSCAVAGVLREVWCWGNNSSGELGNNTYVNSLVPVKVQNLNNVAFVDVTADQASFALRDDKTVWSWGYNNNGKLGDGTGITRPAPVQVINLSSPVYLSVGRHHSCVIEQGGVTKCWGYNYFGNLGDGTTVTTSTPVSVVVPSGQEIVGVSASKITAATLFLMKSNQIWKAGTSSTLIETLSEAAFLTDSGRSLGCYTNISDGALKCASYHYGGGLLTGNNNPFTTQGAGNRGSTVPPAKVVTGLESGVVASSAGSDHSCSILGNGEVRCFGDSNWGELGTGKRDSYSFPINTFSSLSVAKIAQAVFTTCVVTTTGTVHCVGNNGSGELGNGTTTNSTVPVQVTGISAATKICGRQSGARAGFCAIDGSTVKCWGYRYLGNGTNNGTNVVPVTVSGLTDITPVELTCGNETTCVLASSGEVRCWGAGNNGSLGDGLNTTSNVPVSVIGLGAAATSIGSSAGTFCAALQGGGMKCWGSGTSLGNGTSTNSSTPVSVSGITETVVSIAQFGGGGDNPHMCAALSGGGVRCWGSGDGGSLGDGTKNDSTIPVAVSGYNAINVSQVAVGEDHSCALRADGQIACWGSGGYGATGVDTADAVLTPQLVPGITNAISLSAGAFNTCAVLTDNSTKCWGYGGFGNLGNNYSASLTATTPVRFADASMFRARVQTCYKYDD